MKLIIDINENEYKALINDGIQNHIALADELIKNGTPYTERPQGDWIEIPVKRDLLYNTGIKYTCSICGRGNCYGKPPFCMYCGADMRGKEE